MSGDDGVKDLAAADSDALGFATFLFLESVATCESPAS